MNEKSRTPYVYHLPRGLTVHSREEQAELIDRAKAGDYEAAATLVNGVMKLVVATARSVATEYSLDPRRFADAVHEGVLGCYVGLSRYDETFDVKFWTYAMEWVIHYVRNYCTTGIVKVGRDAVRKALTTRRLNAAGAEGWHNITEHTATRALGTLDVGNADELAMVQSEQRDPHDLAAESMDKVVIQNRLFVAAASLNRRDARIIRLRYFTTASDGKRLTLDEVAKEIGMSREWTRLRIVKVLAKMRTIIENGSINNAR